MSNKVKGIIQLILVILFILGSFIISNMLKSDKPFSRNTDNVERTFFVETITVSPTSHRVEFDTTGTVNARANIGIVPQIQGRITSISDKLFEGGQFAAHETLFEVDPRDYQLEVQRLQATVAQAQTALNLEKAEGESAMMDWKILNGDKPAPPLVARAPQMREARANLQAARAQLNNAKLALERSKFSFPFEGRVLSSTLEAGQFVMAGQSYGDVFDLNTLEVQASLEDKQLNWLIDSEAPEITITANYLGETKTYDGVLKRSAGSLDSQTRFARVSFGFKDQNPDLLPGIFADVVVKGSTLENVTVLPAAALQREGNIWTVDADNKLRTHQPNIIYSTNQNIIIDSLRANSRVVTSRVSGASEGMGISVNDNKNESMSQQNNALQSLEIPSTEKTDGKK